MTLRVRRGGQAAEETDAFVVPTGHEPLFPPLPPESQISRRRRWPYVAGAIVLLAAVAAGGLFAWLHFRGPDLGAYDAGLNDAVELAIAVQDAVDQLNQPSDLGAFRGFIDLRTGDLEYFESEAQTLEADRHRQALLSVFSAEENYLAELRRLAGISPKSASSAEFARASELAEENEEAIAAAAALRPRDGQETRLELSSAGLARLLANWRQEWLRIEQERAQAKRLNARRAERLARLRSFTGQMDGIIGRYSGAREELSNWIYTVNTSGASFMEAYEVLSQQTDRRRELRDHLAAQSAPAEFAADHSAILAVMDKAIDATESASRGIAEFQFDSDGYYGSYAETPGWQTFETATDEITRAYASALSTYEQRKKTYFARLSKQTPLPTLPVV